jgi:hypothetical protein
MAGGGASGAGEARPDLPPPPDDSCRRFNFEYSDVACTSPCPPAPCDAANVDDVFRSLGDYWCNLLGARECVRGFDCSLLGDEVLFSCLTSRPCDSDFECAGGRCVVDVGQASGECGTGLEGGRCREDADCQSFHCIAVDDAGKRACATGADFFSLCNRDRDCAEGHCSLPAGSIVGACSGQTVREPCFTKLDCAAGMSCVIVIGAKQLDLPGVGMCTSGANGEPCAANQDCASQHCIAGSNAICVGGKVGDYCSTAADCDSRNCVTQADGSMVCGA